ncbi:MAG: hypothetical protein IJO91_06330 [Oscillospiraceae bacterium]|nr:hypothetical protein [Oscillospiraceae bacterium]
MKKRILPLLTAAMLLLCGCRDDINSSVSEHSSSTEITSSSQTTTTTSQTTITASTTTTPATTTTSSTTTTTVETTPVPEEPEEQPSDLIPPAMQTPKVDGSRLSFSITNIYSEGSYYTAEISGVKLDSTVADDIDTTYINGVHYGDFRLELIQDGEVTDALKINIPRDDRFLILESVLDNLSYGCKLISNYREFSAAEYPDLIQLDFHRNDDPETPQYARFFAVFGGKLMEIPVYEGGVEVAPYGTHLDPMSAGKMKQHIVASQWNGSYTVLQYEYTFKVSSRILERKQVRFTG